MCKNMISAREECRTNYLAVFVREVFLTKLPVLCSNSSVNCSFFLGGGLDGDAFSSSHDMSSLCVDAFPVSLSVRKLCTLFVFLRR